MARALAIETSARTGSLAAVEDGRVLAEDQFPHGLKHAAEIVLRLDQLCRGHGWSPRDMREVYVSAGPGSFTGLRIGITLAKTLAFATGAKVVAVPSVSVLAENAPAGARHAIIVLDAKREQIFTARFERIEGRWQERDAAAVDSLAAVLKRSPRPIHLIGEGIPYHQQFIPSDAGIVVTPPELWRARAMVVGELGRAMALQRRFVDPFELTPIYIRPPEAQEKWDALHKDKA